MPAGAVMTRLTSADVTAMLVQHAGLRSLCDELEACADQLPDRASLHQATRLSAVLVADLRRHDRFDRLLLPPVVACGPDAAGNPMASLFGRVRIAHGADQLHAEDLHETLQEALQAAAAQPGRFRHDAIGYMMRALFDGCRRSIDFQEIAILLLAGESLAIGARQRLCSSLAGA